MNSEKKKSIVHILANSGQKYWCCVYSFTCILLLGLFHTAGKTLPW